MTPIDGLKAQLAVFAAESEIRNAQVDQLSCNIENVERILAEIEECSDYIMGHSTRDPDDIKDAVRRNHQVVFNLHTELRLALGLPYGCPTHYEWA